jgi:hypothetical protein
MSEPYMPARSIKPLTEPVEFHFSTTDRAMQRHAYEVADSEMEAPSAKRNKAAPQMPENGITVPEPFHFTVEERAALKRHRKPKFDSESAESVDEAEFEQHQEYIPLAQQLKRIEKATPDRWKRNPKRTNSPRGPRELTIPQDFRFETDFRSAMRPAYVPLHRISTRLEILFPKQLANQHMFFLLFTDAFSFSFRFPLPYFLPSFPSAFLSFRF